MNVVEPTIEVASVEQLLSILAEAAEIEHGLMCCYLYAAFGLKTDPGDGLPPAQLAAVKRWRGAVMSVAIEEMGHLALVSNLLVALGARPHFVRQNFPVSPGYHPADFTVALAPFDRDTLDHFIFLERPEGSDLADAPGFPVGRRYARGSASARFTPAGQDYATVGHLYREISRALRQLASDLGETVLFCGHVGGQVGPDITSLPGLVVVTDLASALQAIDNIVEQGEGAPGHAEDSHFARFLAIRREYEALLAEDPDFVPSRPIARNPVMRRPPQPEGRVYVEDAGAATILDLGNALYNLMLRCLVQAYGRSDGDVSAKAALVDAAVTIMGSVTRLGQVLTTKPVGPGHPGIQAGLTFATLRGLQPLLEGASEWRILSRRLEELSAGIRDVGSALPGAEDIAASLEGLATAFGQRQAGLARPAASTPAAVPGSDATAKAGTPPPALPGAPAAATTSRDEDGAEVIDGQAIEIHYDGKRCIHARFCVLGAPEVFLANTPGEWIFPDRMDAEKLVAVAENCPSGAIRYRRKDGRPEETPPPVNVVTIRENGPLALRAEIILDGRPEGTRATLCRCGASQNKPYCDGSHVAVAFQASGEPATGDVSALAVRNGPLAVAPQRNGPNRVSGNLEICSGTGRTVSRVTETRLCRCGQSQNKPFCDGSHVRAGFRSDA